MVAGDNKSKDGVWQRLDKSSLKLNHLESKRLAPQRMDSYETFTMNPQALRRILQRASAPPQGTLGANLRASRRGFIAAESGARLMVPLPNGTFTEFNIQETSIMAPALAVKFPNIKTYAGQGLTDKSATLRLDYSPDGLHAMVLSSKGTFYVDSVAQGDNQTHIAYSQEALQRDVRPFRCFTNDDLTKPPKFAPALGETKTFSAGGSLRTYRLAVAATGEYTKYHGGTVAGAMSAINTTVNRVSGIFTQELGISLILVAEEDKIIYTDPDTDPYLRNPQAKDKPIELLKENQDNLENVIKSANYDIGHVFGTEAGGGGLADVGVVCQDKCKARGETGIPMPEGDAFDVICVAHEMAHQFGAHHTFNGTTKDCGRPAGRHAETAYEPGSGSTIMSYAGACDDAENVETWSDDYFHIISLLEIIDYVDGLTRASQGPTPVAINNTPPVVQAGTDHIIPKGTGFTLTATGSDPDRDHLMFCWEEFDLGELSPPYAEEDGRIRPIFRSFKPTITSSRTLPMPNRIVQANLFPGEVYPSLDREITFRVTVRDNYIYGGAFSYDTVKITVSANSGPFKVMEPNPRIWTVGRRQALTWEVANTFGSPVNCTRVNIRLSTDGGDTFPIILASNAPNNGSATFIVPDAKTTRARIKVEAANNIFFDISDADFTIAR